MRSSVEGTDGRTSRCSADVLCCAVEGDWLKALWIIWANWAADDEEKGISGWADADGALGADWGRRVSVDHNALLTYSS